MVSVICSARVAASGASWARTMATNSAQASARAWAARLAGDYGDGPPAATSYSLLLVVVSTYGAWHPEFVRWVRRLLRDRASASAANEAEANGLLGGMLWWVGASLSVAAQRAVFGALAACMPELRAGGGQLGQPLSEEPEFWRAAPDAECIDWVAEELGLEPGRWDRTDASLGPSFEGPLCRRRGAEWRAHAAVPRSCADHAAVPRAHAAVPRAHAAVPRGRADLAAVPRVGGLWRPASGLSPRDCPRRLRGTSTPEGWPRGTRWP